ncbi:MAG: hypothetical protein F6K30_01765 [Cyanothece sp. SIO2G6]|nr:hypothetical protein [Cyanothece sp. SIO2G6]
MRLTPRLTLYTTMVTATALIGMLSIAAKAMAETMASRLEQANIRLEQANFENQIPLGSDGVVEISQSFQEELDAFWNSGYSFWDAEVLARYWGQSLDESKARIGRKILFGPADIAILEQFLLDARIESLSQVQSLNFYLQSEYSYDDAAALAELWGEPSPFESKLRIEKNLIMGNETLIQEALQLAGQR